MKLYYVPRTRAGRVRWLLEELGVPYELVRLDPKAGDTKRPDYLAIHPQGHVPALEDGGQTMFESVAIVLQLADRFADKGLAPAPGTPERATYYQWIVFALTELEPHVASYWHNAVSLPEPERSAPIAAHAKERFLAAAKVLEQSLVGRSWVLGERFSAADVVVGAIVGWARSAKLLEELPGLKGYAGRCLERPASKRASAD